MQLGPVSTSTTLDSNRQYARETVEARDDAPGRRDLTGQVPPTDMIGDVEIASDGSAGVVVAATIVGYVPPGGLMVQVQLEPTQSELDAAAAKTDARQRAGLPAATGGSPEPAVRMRDALTLAEQAEADELRAREAAVRQEEQAHAAAAGALAAPIRYERRTGPDGRRYVVDGPVAIRGVAPGGDPETAARMGRKLAAAALSAPAPSAADYRAAADGYRAAGQAGRIAAETALNAARAQALAV